jgi:hypothetical protein
VRSETKKVPVEPEAHGAKASEMSNVVGHVTMLI